MDGSASLHLEALLQSAADAVATSRNGEGGRPDVSLPLTLVGFSKGTVVLNQLVTELACEARQGVSLEDKTRGSGDGRRFCRKRQRGATGRRRRCAGCVCGRGPAGDHGESSAPSTPTNSSHSEEAFFGRDGGHEEGEEDGRAKGCKAQVAENAVNVSSQVRPRRSALVRVTVRLHGGGTKA